MRADGRGPDTHRVNTGERDVEKPVDDENRESLLELSETASRLSPQRMRQPLEAGWTAAAHLLHLAFWDRRTAQVVDRFRTTGELPGPYDADIVNDAMKPQ